MTRDKGKTKLVSVRLYEDERAVLDDLADHYGISQARVIGSLLMREDRNARASGFLNSGEDRSMSSQPNGTGVSGHGRRQPAAGNASKTTSRRSPRDPLRK